MILTRMNASPLRPHKEGGGNPKRGECGVGKRYGAAYFAPPHQTELIRLNMQTDAYCVVVTTRSTRSIPIFSSPDWKPSSAFFDRAPRRTQHPKAQ